MNKQTLINIINDTEMLEINNCRIEYVVKKGCLYDNGDKIETIEMTNGRRTSSCQ